MAPPKTASCQSTSQGKCKILTRLTVQLMGFILLDVILNGGWRLGAICQIDEDNVAETGQN
jgi:hypothetical protein